MQKGRSKGGTVGIIFQWVFALCLFLPVALSAQESVTLAWNPPTTNTDGTPLNDLARYDLYMALDPIPDDKGTATLIAEIPEGTETATVDVELPVLGARVYFRVVAVDTSGNESKPSNEVSKDFLAPVQVIIRFL